MRCSIVCGLLALALAACQSEPTKEPIGAVAGTLTGDYLGSRISKSMDEKDRAKAAHALETAPTGAPTGWRNPDTGATYTVTPTRTYQEASGPCRDYTTKALIDGKEETVKGTACRQPDGTWKAA
ncbi:MAG: RT0821/Lpp0805 family surface protein [Burkholderiales bacterium]